MRQVFVEKGVVVVKQVCEPQLDAHSVLVSVHYSFISSGTELATLKQAQESLFFTNIPQKIKTVLASVKTNGLEGTAALVKGKIKGSVRSIGYSCSGRIIAVGKQIQGLRVGDYVACAGSGLAHHADIVCVPRNLVAKINNPECLKDASATTIGAIALQGVRRASITLGETVAVIGLGLLGQLTVQLAQRSGAQVIGIDLIPERLELARQSGAIKVLHAQTDAVLDEINFLTHHHGVDTTIITAASASDAIVQQAMEITRKKGKVVVVGDVGLGLQRNPFYAKEIDLLMSCSYGPGRYDTEYEQQGKDYPYSYVRWTEQRNMRAFIALLEQGQLHLDALIGHEVTLETIADAFTALKEQKTLGVVVSYGDKDAPDDQQRKQYASQPTQKIFEKKFIPARKDTLRVGIIGAGGFAKIKLLPLVAKMNNIRLDCVVDTEASNALNVANLYGAAHVLSDYKDLVVDDTVDALVIASPHRYHAAQALDALRNKKAVFLEKPMVTDHAQLHQFETFLKNNPNARLCVDYNRSFAPFIQKIKRILDTRNSPVMMHYRMNAGFIPKDHWIQTDIGAGRLIGEACHIVDLFCYLVGSDPVAVSVEALYAEREDLFPTDNFSAQFSFADGSVCTLLYTALGNKELGKERMELFFDGKSIVMNDYTSLCGFGFKRSIDEVAQRIDKGHQELMSRFFAALQHDTFTPPLTFDRLLRVARLTLLVDQLACGGGGSTEYIT